MAIMIVFRHSIGLGVYSLHGTLYWIEKSLSEVTDLIVPIFFMISGYLFYQNFDYGKLKSKWIGRFKSVVIPYLIWNIVGFVFIYSIFSIPFVSAHSSSKIPSYTSLSFIADVWYNNMYNGPTWFLKNLIYYIYIIPFLYPIFKNKSGYILLIVCMLSGNILVQYAGIYMFGAYMGIHCRDLIQKRYSELLHCLSALYLLSTIIGGLFCQIPFDYLLVLRLTQAICILIIADCFAIESEPKWWMTISFFIYFTHDIILEPIEKIFFIALGDTTAGAIIDLIFAPLLTLLSVILIAKIFRLNKPLWNILTGNRGAA
ncbi:acyltransferase family protein [uncultured Bacteroides sp.]|uniref:acyltransferase family protein n=1 Tax=uncultured Bacteroides sp. TaxID=162156 RepID=UPI002AA9503F|nr:acyltransferase family protein [uncultured Bacteroides sp.]